MSRRHAVLVVAVLALGASFSAQQPPPAQEQQAPPVFRAGTVLVEVDAIVRDRSGKFVADLKPEEFEVLDAGEAQRIEAIYLVQGATVTPALPAAPGPAAPGAGDTPAPPRTQRVFILFFDVDHIAPGGMDRAKKAAATFVAANFQAGDVGGVVAGGTMVNGRLTSDAKELQAAVKSVQPASASVTAFRELRVWPRLLDTSEAWRVVRNERAPDGNGSMLDHVTRRACLERPSDCQQKGGDAAVESELQNKAVMLVNQARLSGQQAVRAMTALTSGLARLPGRKTIVLLSDGFLGEESWADLRQVVGLASRANARFYSLDTRGLNRGSASADILEAQAPSGDALATPGAGDAQADVPNSLAVDTGGIAIRNENDFAKALNEVAADTSSYYVLGYRPTNTAFDGKFRAVTVRVKRAGVSVRARKGYLATPPAVPPAGAAAPGAGPPAARPADGAAAAPGGVSIPPGAATPVVVEGASSASGLRLRPDVGAQVSKLEGGGQKQASAYPQDLLRKARAGWDAYQRGDLSAARASLSPASEHPSAPPWVRYALGWSLYAEGDHAAAGVQWEKVREAVPVFEAVYLDLADAYVQQKEFGKAVATLREAEKRWAQDVEVYNALGVIQAGRGALNDAIATFEKGVSVNPNDETACYNLAKALELRYVQGQRDRRASSMVSVQGILTDRDRAIEYHRRTADLKGRFAGQAAEGVKRLTGK